MKTIGILGGLGPEATSDLFRRIIDITPAKIDQEHIPVIIYNNPKIPDRTKHILYGGESPVDSMKFTARALENAGADFIIMPCNTAHYFAKKVQAHIGIPIINMIEETAEFIKSNYPDVKNVGILATSGTLASNLYEDALRKRKINLITPDFEVQNKLVMAAIYGEEGIKAGYKDVPRQMLESVAEDLIDKGADLIILGCTEVSLVLDQKRVPYVLIDAMQVLAEVSVKKALKYSSKEAVKLSTKDILREMNVNQEK